MLVLLTVIYARKLLGFQNFARLVLELSSSITQVYGQTLFILLILKTKTQIVSWAKNRIALEYVCYFCKKNTDMAMYKISIKTATNPTIRKFEAETFLTQHGNFEFNNIDEAIASPLAQELFYLPFVKKIYISGHFIAIDKFNIVEWADVENEVAQQIEAYLNKGGVVVKRKTSSIKAKVPATVYAESTRDPLVMKFASNKTLVQHSHEFTSINEAKYSPFATQLFHFSSVKRVIIDKNFVSITKSDAADWAEVTMELREFIRNYIADAKPIIDEHLLLVQKKKKEALEKDYAKVDEAPNKIIDILTEYVKPVGANDDGNR